MGRSAPRSYRIRERNRRIGWVVILALIAVAAAYLGGRLMSH